MGTAAAPSHVNNPLAGYISQIDGISIDELVGESRLGPAFSFSDAKPVLENIKEFADELRYIDGSGIPGRAVGNVTIAFQEILSSIEQIRAYTPSHFGGDRPDIRRTYTKQLKDAYEKLTEAASCSSIRPTALIWH